MLITFEQKSILRCFYQFDFFGKLLTTNGSFCQQCRMSYKLNKRILDLIFLAEIVEVFGLHDVDTSILSHVYYRSLKLFSDKLNQAKFKINSLSEQIAREKDVEVNSSLILIGGQFNDLANNPSERLTYKE